MAGTQQIDKAMMQLAAQEAAASLAAGGVPVGACLVDEAGNVLAAGHNERVQSGDPIAHGEMTVLRKAGRRSSYSGCTLYTTLSPCDMCRGAIKLFQIPRVVIGEAETFAGDTEELRAAGIEVEVLGDEACMSLMRQFQQKHPDIWAEDIGQSV